MHRVAYTLRRRLPPHVEIDDLVSAGYTGLVHAADAFNDRRGVSFGAFARRRVLGAMLDYLRGEDMLSRHARRTRRSTGDERVVLLQLGVVVFEDSPTEIASVDPTPLDELLRSHLSQRMRDALDSLSARERYIVDEHIMRERHQFEVAVELGISPGRVSQLLSQALARLRRRLVM